MFKPLKKFLFILPVLICLFPQQIYPNKSLLVKEKEIIQSFSQGDYPLIWTKIKSLLLSNPLHPLSTLYYDNLFHFSKIVGHQEVINTILLMLNKSNNQTKNNLARLLLKEHLHIIKSEYLLSTNHSLPYLVKWECMQTDKNLYNKHSIDLIKNFKKKQKYTYIEKNPNTLISLNNIFNPFKRYIIAQTSFKASKNFKIRIFSTGYYTVYINNRIAIKNTGSNFQSNRVIECQDLKQVRLSFLFRADTFKPFRVLITDMFDKPYKTKPISKISDTTKGKFWTEAHNPDALEYCKRLIKEKPALGYRLLGNYFDSLNSKKALWYYTKSYNISPRPYTLYSKAMLLDKNEIGLSTPGLNSLSTELLQKTEDRSPDFFPAKFALSAFYKKEKTELQLIKEFKKLIKTTPRHIHLHKLYLRLLQKNKLYGEFNKAMVSFQKKFPESIYVYLLKLEKLKQINPDLFVSRAKQVLNKVHLKSVVLDLLKVYKNQKDYLPALSLLKSYNDKGLYKSYIPELLIQARRYKEARKLLLTKAGTEENYRNYFFLGLLEQKAHADPLMYWKKALNLSPSLFSLHDYSHYLEYSNEFTTSTFKGFNQNYISKILSDGRESSIILSKEMIYNINNDQSSKLISNIYIFIRDKQGAENWGEYKVPFSGDVKPVAIRVLDRKGNIYNSFTVNNINGSTYFTVSSLKPQSILQLSYSINNPYDENYELQNTFLHPIQNYYEPVKYFNLKVITNKTMPVNLFCNIPGSVKTSYNNGEKIYSCTVNDLNSITRESYTASFINTLPYFSISNFESTADFISEYRNKINNMPNPYVLSKDKKNYNAIDKLETLKSIYSLVTEKVSVNRKNSLNPSLPDETLARGSGSTEDCVILAWKLLKQRGIQAYPALVKPIEFPADKAIKNPYKFQHLLLYIPLDKGKAIWLDFTKDILAFGQIREELHELQAQVITHNSFISKKVKSALTKKIDISLTIKLTQSGGAELSSTLSLTGLSQVSRKRVAQKTKREKFIRQYYENFIPSLDIYSISPISGKNQTEEIKIRTRALSYGIAIEGKKKLLLKPLLKETGLMGFIRSNPRNHPLFIKKDISENEEYVYILPKNYSYMGKSTNVKLNSEFGYAQIKIFNDKNKGRVIINRSIYVRKQKINPDKYRDFMNFVLKLKKYENKVITLLSSSKS